MQRSYIKEIISDNYKKYADKITDNRNVEYFIIK